MLIVLFLWSMYICNHKILVDDKYSAMLGDFGVVTAALPYSLALGTVALAGTLGYLPPEFTDGKHGLRSDMNTQLWSGKFLLCALNKSHWNHLDKYIKGFLWRHRHTLAEGIFKLGGVFYSERR